MEFEWRIAVGSVIGFLGAAFGSVGGVGGGGIFVPMLILIIALSLSLSLSRDYRKRVIFIVRVNLQIPVAGSATLYEAVSLYIGRRKMAQLFIYCSSGVVAGVAGGLLGLGGGFILGPLFLELGLPPQVSSSQTLASRKLMESLNVWNIGLRLAAVYFGLVAAVAALNGQVVVGRWIVATGRASLIIFILASMIFISALSLVMEMVTGGVGVSDMLERIEKHEYMGFEDLCGHQP
ncbi:hypothetical protein BHM03_00026010 [Ensete ventricosum]|nr:hypothetical protein BHM03_00026010 [Ensete ventricosum]